MAAVNTRTVMLAWANEAVELSSVIKSLAKSED